MVVSGLLCRRSRCACSQPTSRTSVSPAPRRPPWSSRYSPLSESIPGTSAFFESTRISRRAPSVVIAGGTKPYSLRTWNTGCSWRIASISSESRPSVEPQILRARCEASQYPSIVETARLDVRWFMSDDFSIHYLETMTDDQWECRWDHHLNPITHASTFIGCQKETRLPISLGPRYT